MDRSAIRDERLTTWAVTPDGERVRLGLEDDAGRPCAVSLPTSLLSALMMTIPRMLRQALKVRRADGSLRMLQQLAGWRIERAAGADNFILTLATPDRFEMTFAVAAPQADLLGETLRESAAPVVVQPRIVN
jgi:predicted NAD/FAD-dependent oxidoreductase